MEDPGYPAARLLLPDILRAGLPSAGEKIEEIRLRTGRRAVLSAAGAEWETGDARVTAEHLRQVLESATRSSLHAALESLRRGYVTADCGCRVGVCGTAAVRDGEIASIREPSSLCIRISRAQPGVGAPLLAQLLEGEEPCSTLLISPPGAGKTTLLRDLVRLFSLRGIRTAVADERGEIAAMRDGVPRFDVGPCTDVLTGAPKKAGVMMLLRTMSPRLLALDEISEASDAEAVIRAANSGAAILATVHGRDLRDARRRPALTEIFRQGIFRRAVTITLHGAEREFRVDAPEGG